MTTAVRTCKLLYLGPLDGYEGTDEENFLDTRFQNSDMLLNSSRISTLHTQPNLALYQVFPNPDLQPSGVLHS